DRDGLGQREILIAADVALKLAGGDADERGVGLLHVSCIIRETREIAMLWRDRVGADGGLRVGVKRRCGKIVWTPYGLGMDDQGDIARGAPRHWVGALDRAETEVAAGLAVDGAAVRQRLRDT